MQGFRLSLLVRRAPCALVNPYPQRRMPFPAPYIRSLRIAGAAGAATVLAGLLVFVGWMTGCHSLTQIREEWTPMVPMTALSFVCAGSALVAIMMTMVRSVGKSPRPGAVTERWRSAAVVLGLLTAVIGARRILYYAMGWPTNWDMLGFTPHAGPGRMALLTAAGFLLTGLGLAATARRVFNQVAQAIAGLVLFIGWIGLARYIYGGEQSGVLFLMAMPTAVLFGVLGAGMFFARPDGGFVKVWNSDTSGGSLLRRLFPAALFVPVLVGWLRLMGERAGWYGLETGLAIFAMSNVLIFATLAWHTANRLHREDLERREVESTLRAERDFSDTIVDSLPGAFYLYTKEGRFLRWNMNFERVTGYSSVEIARMHPLDFFSETEKPRLMERIAEVFDKGVSEVEAGFRAKDGTVTPYFFTGMTVTFRGETCLVGVGIDIAERRRAEDKVRELNAELEVRVAARTAELQAKNRELETFTYSVSHDLKAPLRGIDGYSRLLEEDYSDKVDEEGRRFLAAVRKATQQMGQLIDDLLAYSQLERRAMKLTPVRPRAILDALPFGYLEDIRARGVEFVVDLPDVAVSADANGLAQVLRNLLDNALKFTRTSSAPRIEVGGRIEGNRYLLWVRDNGIGFEMKFVERIFDIFQRLHRAEDYPGTGIGLAIVRKAMERMGGRAWAQGELGLGATFFVEIPLHT